LQARGGVHAEALAPGRAVRSALNQKMCAESALLSDGDELAFFPPVTGG
jgi:molybdopterin synthase sulfur carrier subunit